MDVDGCRNDQRARTCAESDMYVIRHFPAAVTPWETAQLRSPMSSRNPRLITEPFGHRQPSNSIQNARQHRTRLTVKTAHDLDRDIDRASSVPGTLFWADRKQAEKQVMS